MLWLLTLYKSVFFFFFPGQANGVVGAEMESKMIVTEPSFLVYVVYEDGIYN